MEVVMLVITSVTPLWHDFGLSTNDVLYNQPMFTNKPMLQPRDTMSVAPKYNKHLPEWQ